MKRLVYKSQDGSLKIVVPVNQKMEIEEVRKRTEEANPELKECIYAGEFEEKDFPKDREFRNCWRLTPDNKPRVDPVLENEQRWKRIREKRNLLLSESDGMMTRALETGVKQKEWGDYRQALRDITNQTDPKNVVFPQKPE